MNNNGQKQVSLAGAAGQTRRAQRAKKTVSAKWIIWAVLVVLLAAVVLIVTLSGKNEGPVLSSREMVTYTVTPDELSNKVSYFALGVTGEDSTDRMDMVAVMCFDRKAKSVSVIQIPVSTYVGKNNGFGANAIGDVWSHPVSEMFCSACRVKVSEEELDGKKHAATITIDGVETVCGAKVEMLTGSSSSDFIRVFNEQYGLPIDNFIVIPRNGLVELIDSLEGIEVNLPKKMKLAGETYESGWQTLSGDAAVSYAITYNYKKTPDSDRERMLRQRQVFAGLIQCFKERKFDDLYKWNSKDETASGAFASLMLSDVPVRFNSTTFGKERLLNIPNTRAEKMKLSEAIARFAEDMGKVSLDKFTFSILPGQTTKYGTATVYSVNKSQVLELLNSQMNPYALTLDDATVSVEQLVNYPKTADTKTETLQSVVGEG